MTEKAIREYAPSPPRLNLGHCAACFYGRRGSVYRHCLFCAADLGTNQVIEPFPVGRRLAFDSARGRLWVVCRTCERWNLTPLEERWEAVETCEQHFRDTRLRVSTENIGLARLLEGLELVRVGKPQRPEFAAWRYGDQFGKRRKKYLIGSGIGILAFSAVHLGASAVFGAGVGALPYYVWQAVRNRSRRIPARIPTAEGKVLEFDALRIGAAKLRPISVGGEHGWQLEVPHPDRTEILTGDVAVHALGLFLPRINVEGAGRGEVQEAVREIEALGDPRRYFAVAELRARRMGRGYSALQAMPKAIRLTLEMAAHEETERAALEGELRLLEQQAESPPGRV